MSTDDKNLLRVQGTPGGGAGLKLPTLRKSQQPSPAQKKPLKLQSSYAILKSDWERVAQNESIKECLDQMLAQDRGVDRSAEFKAAKAKAKPKGVTKGMVPSRKVKKGKDREANMLIQQQDGG